MTRRRDIKKSDFVLVDSSESNDTFDLVRNGQNLKIKQSSLISDFGVSGPLVVRGESTATPVLTVIASVNYIRNILGGSGINVALSAQDGVEISHNFTADSTGVPVLINTGSDSPTVRSIQAGSGISVSGAGGIIQVSSTGVPASSKTIIVYDISDFPTPVGDLITLADETEYRLENDISSAYRFLLGTNTVLSGADDYLIELEYTGIGTMITVVDDTVKIKDIYLSCASATMFDVSSSTGAHVFRMFNCRGLCDNVGTFDNLQSMQWHDVNFEAVYTQGVELSGTFYVVLFDTLSLQMPSGTGNGINLGTAVITYFTIDKAVIAVSTSGYSMSGLANSGNIASDGLGVVFNSRNFGTAAPTDNIFPTDDRWEFSLNVEVPNSYDTVLATHGGATIAIATAATPVIVGATWTEQVASRFTTTAGGRWTYTGKGASVEITASVTADIVTASDSVTFFFYLNGVQITASAVSRTFSAGSPGNISMVWEEYLDTSDYLELWVQNDDTNVDVIIVNATMRIRS